MLIVVAIIAILIAVSIPLVSSALEKTRNATDEANMRAAKAEAMLCYLGQADIYSDATTTVSTDKFEGKAIGITGAELTTVYYDANKGCLITDKTKITAGYGKCTSPDSCKITGHDGSSTTNTNYIIQVEVSATGEFTGKWVTK